MNRTTAGEYAFLLTEHPGPRQPRTPPGTQELAVEMLDPDAQGGTFTHWLVYRIPPGITSLANMPQGAAEGINDFGRRGKIRKRKKAASRRFRGAYGHTPLSIAEDIPWRCRRLVVGTGADGALPGMQQVQAEARRRKVDLVVVPTAKAISALTKATADTNAILHLTC